MKKKLSIFNQTYSISGRKGDEYFDNINVGIPYSEPIFNFLRQMIQPDSICLDIGANIGLVSLALSDLNTKGVTYAFEPTPDIFALLKENIEENDIINVKPIQLALSDKKEKISFINVGDYPAGNFGVSEKNAKKKWDEFGELLKVSAVPLDEWVKSNPLKKLDFIKLDVEGAELHVLKGSKKTIEKYQPLVIMEFNSYCYIFHQNITPYDALTEIMTYFQEVYKINKGDLTVQKISKTENSKLQFIDENLRNGFVDDLICIPKGRALPRLDNIKLTITTLQLEIERLKQENKRSLKDLNRIQNTKGWKMIKLLQKLRPF